MSYNYQWWKKCPKITEAEYRNPPLYGKTYKEVRSTGRYVTGKPKIPGKI